MVEESIYSHFISDIKSQRISVTILLYSLISNGIFGIICFVSVKISTVKTFLTQPILYGVSRIKTTMDLTPISWVYTEERILGNFNTYRAQPM